MALACLDMSDPVRHVQGCQFPDNARLDPAHEAVLSPQNQVQILLRQQSPKTRLEEGVHSLVEVEVKLVVKVRRDVPVVSLLLVFVSTEESRDSLCEFEIVWVEASQVTQSRQLGAPNGEHPALARSRGVEV